MGDVRFFVVAAREVKKTAQVSYMFLIQANICPDRDPGVYGFVDLEERGANEINPWKLVRGEPGAIGPNGVKRWKVFLGSGSKGQIFGGSVDEDPGREEGLQKLLKDAPEGVFLIEEKFVSRFEAACRAAKIPVDVRHFDGVLATG